MARQTVTGNADREMADRAHHEQQARGIPEEARHAKQAAADQHDDAVEEVPSRDLASRQPLACSTEDSQPDPPQDERP
jgi:hypothetical protein